jgi:hypothetical protein
MFCIQPVFQELLSSRQLIFQASQLQPHVLHRDPLHAKALDGVFLLLLQDGNLPTKGVYYRLCAHSLAVMVARSLQGIRVRPLRVYYHIWTQSSLAVHQIGLCCPKNSQSSGQLSLARSHVPIQKHGLCHTVYFLIDGESLMVNDSRAVYFYRKQSE